MSLTPPPFFRRQWKRLASLALIAGMASGAMGAEELAATRTAETPGWPQFLGPERDGRYLGSPLAEQWPAGGPAVVWKRAVGQGFAGPVVVGAKALLFHRVKDRDTLECFDAHTGKTLWTAGYPTDYHDDFGFDAGPRATPTIAEGRVYTYGAAGVLACWNMQDGKQLWMIDARKTFRADKGFFGAACSPLVEKDLVIVNVGGPDGAGIVAFDAGTGKVRWKATDDEAGYASPIAASLGEKGETRCILDFNRAGLVCLNPANGKTLFRFPWRSRMDASVNAATPLIVGRAQDHVFLSASYGAGAVLLRVDPADLEKAPKVLWSGDDSLSNHYATSVFRDGFLFGFHGRQEQTPSLRCVECWSGRVCWTEPDFGAGSILLTGNRLLILTEKGRLLLAKATPDGFKPTASAQVLPFGVRAYPALADGFLYARSKDELICLDLRPASP